MNNAYLFLFLSGFFAGVTIFLLIMLLKKEKNEPIYEYVIDNSVRGYEVLRIITVRGDEGWRLVTVTENTKDGVAFFWERIKRPLLPNQ